MMTSPLLFIAAVMLAVHASISGSLKVPSDCTVAPKAIASHDGYADRVIHTKTGIELVLVPAGSFEMGAVGPGYFSNTAPVHRVTIDRPYYVGKTEVTNGQFKRFMASGYEGAKDVDPAFDLYARHLRAKSIMPTAESSPMIYISWKNAKAFCDWAGGLDLPSEAEWEYACRAGTGSMFYFGEDPAQLDNYAWTLTNSKALPNPVAQLQPNAWGLYDMHGNAWEWTLDDYVYGYDSAPADGSARVEGKLTKVLRSGSWSNAANSYAMTSASRFNSAPANASNDVGFRVVLRMKQDQ